MNSNILRAVGRCMRVAKAESRVNKEIMDNMVTSSEQGQYIGYNVKNIIKSREVIDAQKASETPNDKVIAHATENIKICTNIIKSRLIQLNATDDEIASILSDLGKADYESVTLSVLKLMVRKNPELHKRKYEQALAMVASKQKQH